MQQKSTLAGLIRTTTVVMIVVPLIVAAALLSHHTRVTRLQRMDHVRSIAEILIYTYDRMPAGEREAWLVQALTTTIADREINAIEVIDNRNQPVLNINIEELDRNNGDAVIAARNNSGDLIRVLAAVPDNTALWLRGLVLTVLLSSIATLGFVATTRVRLQAIRESIAGVVHAITSFRQLDFRARVPEVGDEDFVQLEHAVNRMGETLEQKQRENSEVVATATHDLQATLEEVEIKNVELDLARKRAQDETRAKSEFLAAMSHEIRTPMNSIAGYSQLLAQTQLDDSQNGYVGNIRQAATALLEIIEDILHLSRMEAGKLVIASREFDICQIVRQCAAMVAPAAYQKKLEFRTIIATDIAAIFLGDPLRIRQIITNLLSNAVKFTPHGEVTLEVSCVRLAGRNVTLQLSVADTGRGISHEDRARLFEPFTAASNEERAGGAGLGLTITKSLTRAMGGQLSLQSELGSGSVFTVRLPLKADFSRTFSFYPALRGLNVLCALADERTRAHVLECCNATGVKVSVLSGWRDRALSADGKHAGVDAIVLDVRAGEIDEYCQRPASRTPGVALVPSADSGTLSRVAAAVNGHALPSYASGNDVLAALASLSGADVPHYRHSDADIRSADVAGRHVLVADDDRLGRAYLSELLGQHGVRVTACADGQQAVNLARNVAFDMIFMDARMPICDGVEATRQIRRQARNAGTPIIALTASALPHERERYRAAGMNECLVKPASTADIIGVLAGHREHSPQPDDSDVLSAATAGTPLGHLDDEMRMLLRAELPLYLRRIGKLRQHYDAADLLEASHKLHGTAAVCQLDTLRNCAAHIESALRQGNSRAARRQLDALHSQIATVITALAGTPNDNGSETERSA